MNHLIPDYIFNEIYEIKPDFLLEKGIRVVLFDLDGTIVPHGVAYPTADFRAYLTALRQAGLQVAVVSNNNARRVGTFCRALELPFTSKAYKPFGKALLHAQTKFNVSATEVMLIGDQLLTDVVGAHRAGIRVCYVHTLDRHHFALARLRYRLEQKYLTRRCDKREGR